MVDDEKMRKLSLRQVEVVPTGGMIGLDADGVVWTKENYNKPWTRVSMVTDELKTPLCPRCRRTKDDPELIVKADGHGGLNRYCTHEFHKQGG